MSINRATIIVTLLTFFVASSFGGYNVATDWVEIHTNLYGATGAFPLTYFLRAEYLVDQAMFDAASAYTSSITPNLGRSNIPLRHGGSPTQREQNRKIALSYAAYRVLNNIYAGFPTQFAAIIDPFFTSLGFNKNFVAEDDTPAGVGNKVARLIIESRRHDGSNQYGDVPGSNAGPYSDYTNYVSVNEPQAQPGRTQCSELRSLNHWQPLLVTIFPGLDIVQTYEGANFGFVTPFALTSGLDFLPPGPPLLGTSTHNEAMRQIQQVVNISGSLDDYKKVAAEFWGLHHFSLFAGQLAQERGLDLVDTIKLIFLHGAVELDGAISAWGIKRLFDSYRPISVIQCLYHGQTIKSWYAPYQGVQNIPGETWNSYPLYNIITPLWRTPAFPEYISGHAISAGAVFEAYKLFFGSDSWGASVTIPAGGSLIEPKITAGNPGYVAGVTDVPNSGPETVGYSPANPVTLSWPKFSDAAREAASSRIYLGIHFESGCKDALDVGKAVTQKVWAKYNTLVSERGRD